MTAKGQGLSSGGIEQKGKRIHGHGQQCGDCGGEGHIRDWMVMENITIEESLKKENK